ncbi:uncharacterized protein BJ171DRAFT_221108 [Polychytrium aggregatum]|uniref:uncharacterized protein n=1 Tax=Polychytrium aggregatum TaxID=110093 RepID=UPI0022FF450E|nr:uncharacterized protein BJ171DRAFT_221108 [Polychytrium aggregatum]KAI9197463.1 hypothetical protein BJ171DRAFT_221108 [Polychytrium aggregatum]
MASFMPNGHLRTSVGKKKHSFRRKLRLLYQVALETVYSHNRDISHGGVKNAGVRTKHKAVSTNPTNATPSVAPKPWKAFHHQDHHLCNHHPQRPQQPQAIELQAAGPSYPPRSGHNSFRTSALSRSINPADSPPSVTSQLPSSGATSDTILHQV